ncbi:MAG: DUF3459 domain-containing protein, partial [Thermoleophilia bacterium]
REGVEGSTLEMYRSALQLRSQHKLGLGSVEWLSGYGDEVVAYRNGRVTVIADLGQTPVELPAGDVVLASADISGRALPTDTTVWIA